MARTASGSRPSEVRVESDGNDRRAFLLTADAPVEIGPNREDVEVQSGTPIDPDEIISTYGADTARWFMLSDSPPERDVIWTEAGVQGAFKQTQRLWRLICEIERIVGQRSGHRRPLRGIGDEAQRIRRHRPHRDGEELRTKWSACASMSASPRSTS